MRNRDFKNYRAQRELEEVVLTRNSVVLILFLMLALFSWATERDSHPFHDRPIYQVEARS